MHGEAVAVEGVDEVVGGGGDVGEDAEPREVIDAFGDLEVPSGKVRRQTPW